MLAIRSTRQDRILAEQVLHSLAVKTTTYSMAVYDRVVQCSTASGAWTLTLPSVTEAAGQQYAIKMTAGAGSGAAPNFLSVERKNKDAKRWGGPYKLWRAGQHVVFWSDGEEWHIVSQNISPLSLPRKGFWERFDTPPVMYGVTTAAVGGATGNTNVLRMGSGNTFLHHVKGAGQTLLAPIWVNPGLNISQDLTDDEGAEYTTSLTADTGNRTVFTVGTDAAFYTRARITIADVSGTDDFAIGFRKREAFQANIDDYDEMAVLNVISGNITIETILNNGATTVTDTTNNWADTETHTLGVYVSGAGVVTYQIDDAAPVTVESFTFDSGEVVVPFIFFLHAADVAEATIVLEWECGYQQ
jgi:hypothetical protein